MTAFLMAGRCRRFWRRLPVRCAGAGGHRAGEGCNAARARQMEPGGDRLPPCRLRDCVCFRLRQTLAEDGPVIQPFDQDKWAATYLASSRRQALEVFSAMRRWNLRLIAQRCRRRPAESTTHPERGTMTFQTIVETMAGHDLNHLGQLHRLAGA